MKIFKLYQHETDSAVPAKKPSDNVNGECLLSLCTSFLIIGLVIGFFAGVLMR